MGNRQSQTLDNFVPTNNVSRTYRAIEVIRCQDQENARDKRNFEIADRIEYRVGDRRRTSCYFYRCATM